MEDNIKNSLKILADYKTLIITIGNRYRSDDGVGPFIFDNLKIESENIYIINAEDKPENIIDEAVTINPEKVLIIDAANFGGIPGEIRIIPQEYIPNSTLSTHTFPIKIVAKILEEDTKSEILFLGIQPLSMEFKEELSKIVNQSANKIIYFLNHSL